MLSKTAEYSLRAVACLAEAGGTPAPADDLAGKTMIPRRYLHRVLGDLSRAGLIESRPGPGGGYRLVVDVTKLTILDVLDAVAPVPRIRECPLGRPEHAELCPLHRELDRAYASVETAFRKVTIRDLLRSGSDQLPVPLCTGGCP